MVERRVQTIAALRLLEHLLEAVGIDRLSADPLGVWSTFRLFLTTTVEGNSNAQFLVEWGNNPSGPKPTTYFHMVRMLAVTIDGEYDHTEEIRLDLRCQTRLLQPKTALFCGPHCEHSLPRSLFEVERHPDFGRLIRSLLPWQLEVSHQWQ